MRLSASPHLPEISALRSIVLVAALGFLSCSGGDPGSGGRSASDSPGTAAQSAAAGAEGGAHAVVTDDAGIEHRFDAAPMRIVSLVPSATETLGRLGMSERLVARTDYDTLAALSHLPSVGGGLHPNLEALLAVDPDLVIRFVGESDQTTPSRLSEMGIRHFAVQPERIEDVYRIIENLGQIMGAPDAAEHIVGEIEEELGSLAVQAAALPRVKVAYVLGGTPPWVAGPGTYLEELLEIVGGENVFVDLEARYSGISPEELVAREIDLLLAPEGVQIDLPASHPPLRRVPPTVEIPGPWLDRSARQLARALHPGEFR